MKNIIRYSLPFLFLFIPVPALAADCYVDGTTGSDSNGGTSWGDAFKTIQKGLDNAIAGDTVRVADGTYSGENNCDLTFTGKAITLVAENGSENCVIDCGNSYRAFNFTNSETVSSIVDGFTIINGDPDDYGGAIYCSDASPTIKNCLVTDCISPDWGGAIYAYNSSLTIDSCTILNCNGGSSGGAFYFNLGNPAVTGCKIRNCQGPSNGGGIHSNNSSMLVESCEIVFNNAYSGYGGGIFCEDGYPSIVNTVIGKNFASDGGGLYFMGLCNASLVSCTVASNKATMYGGGIYIYGNALGTANNTIIIFNEADMDGFQLYFGGSTPQLDFYTCDYSDESGDIGNSGTYTFNPYDCVIDYDPKFVFGYGGDFRLLSTSECLDIGCNAYTAGLTEDFNGDPRITNITVDIGADEWVSDPAMTYLYVNVNGGSDLNNGLDWDYAKATIQKAIDAAPGSLCEITVADGYYMGENNYNLNFHGRAITLLSGNGSENCILDLMGYFARAFSFGTGETPGTVVDGFTIMNGNPRTSPTIRNCLIGNCQSSNWGGGVFSYCGDPVIENCEFLNCNAMSRGGAVYLDCSSAQIRGCEMRQCDTSDGGAIYSKYGEMLVESCEIVFNCASISGGGIYCENGRPRIVNTVLGKNYAGSGAGLYIRDYCNASIASCTIAYNNSSNDGGGIYIGDYSNVVANNSILFFNYASMFGRQLYFGSMAGWVDFYTCDYSNSSGDINDYANFYPDPDCVIDYDPKFVFGYGGDFRLLSTSECLDIGCNAYTAGLTEDFNGDPRITNTNVDIGADEWVSDPAMTYLFVNVNGGSDLNNGLDWDYAKATIQKAIDAAPGSLCEITVADGYYMGQNNCNIDFHGRAITLLSGNGSADGYYMGQNNCNIDFHGRAITLLSGNGSENCIIDLNTTFEGRAFIFETNETSETVVDGFTIINGDPGGDGGAIRCWQARPIIRNCRITDCNASGMGGAIYAWEAGLVIDNCTILNCHAMSGGGAIYFNSGDPAIKRSEIRDCWSDFYGGAIYAYNSSMLVESCEIVFNNASSNDGGGIYCYGGYPDMVNTVIGKNRADNGSGVCFTEYCNASLVSCTIANNRASNYGGGIYIGHYSNVVANNSIVIFNETLTDGQQLYFSSMADWVEFYTCDYSTAPDDISGDSGYSFMPFECVQNYDPKFVFGYGGDFRLLSTSECLDIGCNAYTAGLTEDFNGDPRIVNTTVDIGADEWVNDPPTTYLYVSDSAGNDDYDGLSWGSAKQTIQAAIDVAPDYLCLIRVADGTYSGINNSYIDFHGKAITLKAVNGPINCIINLNSSDRAFLFESQETNDTVVDGFKIINGSPAGSGGAIYCWDSRPTIKNCIITNCNTPGSGGAVYCSWSDIIIENCTILSCYAMNNGGAIYTIGGDPTIRGCEMRNCYADGYGGAIYSYYSDVFVGSCEIVFNNVTGSYNGGGIYCDGGYPLIANTVLGLNNANDGGGLYTWQSNPQVINCTVSGNYAASSGGGIYVGPGTTVLANNTIILYNNSASSGKQIYAADFSSYAKLYYCDYSNDAGDLGGVGTVNADPNCVLNYNPAFVDPANGDFRITTATQCRDIGCNSYITAGMTADLAGFPRIMGGTVDMGAYESTPAPGIPDGLLVNGLVNPDALGGANILFSAIHHGEGEGAAAGDAWILVDNDPSFLSPEWNSTWIVLNPSTAPGTRCINIPYAGAPLSPGVSYYWKLKFNNKNDQEGPYSNENASFKKAQFTVDFENAGWHLLQIPCYTGSRTVGELLGDDLAILWIWRYDEAARNWVQVTANETFQNGVGYFVWCKYPGEVAGFNGEGITGGTDPVQLSWTNTGSFGNDGWNLVRHPYPSALSWFGDTSLQNCQTTHWYPWNGDEYLLYDKSTGGCGSDTIPAGASFWVHANGSNAEILFFEPGGAPRPLPPPVLNWKVRFEAKSGAYQDTQSYIGARHGALFSHDQYDILKIRSYSLDYIRV
ncbi:MAG: hypothetical protein ACYTEQ_25680, partial [Planctomycetota bacterium]